MPSALRTNPPDTVPDRGSRTQRARAGVLDSIRQAAIDEFSVHGFNGTSTQSIANRAGLTKPQLHYYIAGKEELYEEVLHSVLNDRIMSLALDNSDPRAELSSYIRRKLDYALDNPAQSRIFTNEIISGGRFLSKYLPRAVESAQRNVDVINEWIAKGLLRPLDGRMLLMHIWAMTQQYADYSMRTRAILGLKANAPIDRERVAHEITSLVLEGCAPSGKGESAKPKIGSSRRKRGAE